MSDNQGIAYFDFVITKASVDQETGQKRWACVASDTSVDQLNDEMHKALFDSFLHRIKNNVEVPEPWQSEFWKGGMPYLSLSHYSDGNGSSVPGPVDAVYLDGELLKAKGSFDDTPLGEAAYNAVRDSYKKVKSGAITDGFQPVRISIGFLDYKHAHKSNGYVFERKSLGEACPECVKEFAMELSGKDRQGVIFQDGQLIHLALTRVPVNQRTEIGLEEVNRSMTTRKDDAASIVGEELAEEIDERETTEVGKALVTKSEDEPEVEVSTEVEEVVKSHFYTMADGMTSMERADAAYNINDVFYLLEEVVWNITFNGRDEFPTAESMKSAVRRALEDASEMVVARGLAVMKSLPLIESEPDALDEAYAALKEKFGNVDKSDPANMAELQSDFDAFAGVIRSEFSGEGTTAEVESEEPVEGVEEGGNAPEAVDIAEEIEKAVLKAMTPVSERLSVIEEGQKEQANATVRRGVLTTDSLVVNDPANHSDKQPKKEVDALTRQINRSVGLPEDFDGRREARIVTSG